MIGGMIPQELQDALRACPQFDPSLVREEYQDNVKLWQFYYDLLELDGNKLQNLIEKHSHDEDKHKFELRKKLACAINLVPTLINMLRGYLFSDEPNIDVKGDKDLEKFLSNCDGTGKSYIDYVRQKILPMCALQGLCDVLVQQQRVVGEIKSQRDLEESDIAPTLFPIALTKRINWSVQTSGQYNWICFEDKGNENPHPLLRNILTPISYITLSAENSDFAQSPDGTGCWIRSWLPINSGPANSPTAAPGMILAPTTETDAFSSGRFVHEADWTPTARVPVATIYWQESNDPENRHMGVSKVAVIATLTNLIIQVLSWSTEDILANLPLLALATEGGRPPRDPATGESATPQVSIWSYLFYNKESKHAPFYVQGSVDHIEIKMKLVDRLIEEILRIAHMMGVSGRGKGGSGGGGEKSGFHAVVNRTELIQELKDAAGNLDRFTLEVFAMVKSWATGEDWTKERLVKEIGPTVDFFKGPWCTESVGEVLEEAEAAIELFREVSPSVVEAAFKKAARAYLYQSDPAVESAMDEIEENTAKFLEAMDANALIGEAAAIAAGKVTGTMNVTESTTQTDDGSGNAPQQQDPPPTTKAKAAATAGE